jgi:FixJ family two-component response regulator
MTKKALNKKATVILIMQDRHQCRDMADGVRQSGYDVTEYQTGREFLIDKRNHQRGVVLSEIRLLGSMGTELVEQLAGEKDTFPVVLLSNHADIPKVVKGN